MSSFRNNTLHLLPKRMALGTKSHPTQFSTDLDFAADDEGIGGIVLDSLDGAELYEVRFDLVVVTEGRRAELTVTTRLGSPTIDAKIEIVSHRP